MLSIQSAQNQCLMPRPIRITNSTLRLKQQIKKLTTLLKEKQVNQVNQSNSRPAHVNDKSKQNITRFCSYCRGNGHALMYCRTKAHDYEIKRQQTRNNQERRTVFTHAYIKRRGPNSESSELQSETQTRESE